MNEMINALQKVYDVEDCHNILEGGCVSGCGCVCECVSKGVSVCGDVVRLLDWCVGDGVRKSIWCV